MIPWSPIDPETPLSDLLGEMALAEGADGRALLLKISTADPPSDGRRVDHFEVDSYASFGMFKRKRDVLPGYVPVSGACVARSVLPQRIIRVPSTAVWPDSGQPYFPTETGQVTFAELVANGPPASVRRQGALAMADTVKLTYGRMLTDIAYRIEQAALFDSAVPTTRSFANALAVWNDLDLDAADEDELVRLAGTLKLAFDAARAHAETVGLGHLPETARGDARRAAGAARLASGAKTEGERTAAQDQVIRILRSLALHYLPEPDHPQLTAGP